MILFGEGGVRHAVSQYVEYYHKERVHSVLGRRIENSPQAPPTNLEISPNTGTSPDWAAVSNAMTASPDAATSFSSAAIPAAAAVPDLAASPGSAAVPNAATVVSGAMVATPGSPPELRLATPATIDEVRCRERLGGLLKSYYRQAA